MAHDHHDHDHSIKLENVNTAFIIGIIFNFLFVILEVIVGIAIHSMSLLSDAAHNLGDVGALALSLLAFRLLKVKADHRHSYGFKKASILASLFNAVVLLISMGVILYEAIRHIFHPAPLPGITVSIVAGIGIVINAVTGIMFVKNKDKDINVKSAYLHLMSDALVSVGIVIAGVIIHFTHFYLVDSIVSILLVSFVVYTTWNLLKTSMRLSIDGMPEGIEIKKIHAEVLKIPAVMAIHHIHVWAISTLENAMTAHFVLKNEISNDEIVKVKHEVRHVLEHLNIQHLTMEIEMEGDNCDRDQC
ncbi:cation transporter [Mucilaginibacter rubeus]|uniref:Cation transporter n=1 Tax=Mucilaginibacter rubeus TaxID=2027860 RepID=A0AAE6JNE7_9SPHI|nr:MULTISPECIES: cation diffusion facilitator family transporter [Mucilaginibacter]QEM07817.1 cation transporter [Mucilaginibacter rubeus]QEM20269.1 cation transporter [Mucilaginibacter gossypii]QTE43014.1 cation transporter [Mucilaginibacter rubeus]QTE49615.1 cation transporter [Mucilaginibacter rubeus]QTE54710.1 cation transporter [Mucilaginibacter rubeus]